MGKKTSEDVQVMMAFPGGRYGFLAGGDTAMANGKAIPGDTGVMGDTGPLGGPIDISSAERCLVKITEKGGTAVAMTVTAKHGSKPWFNDAGTTAVGSFTATLATGESNYQREIDLDCRGLQKYLWIVVTETAKSDAQFGIDVVLSSTDKSPPANNVVLSL